ncbi:hypothetical protein DL96DRAFT_1765551 [Flagelloscypha sp. PMI_526]|nr:hypothetical protein DL96DRAFT_1765551 [Flagelloscypha sp. PMI_526]
MSLPISEDVLTEIFHIIHDIDRKTIFYLNVVNSNFHSLALPFIYRECSFDLSAGVQHEDLQRIQRWLDLSGNLSWVPNDIRQFTLCNQRPCYFAFSPETWTPFLKLIPRMKRLVTFVFDIYNALLPKILLQALEVNIPHVYLAIRHWNLGNSKDTDPDSHLDALARSPLLREVHAVNKAAPHDVTLVAFRRFISLAPKLQKVVVCAPHPNERFQGFCGNVWRGHSEAMARAEAKFSLPSNGIYKPLLQEIRHLEVTHAPADFAEKCLRIVNPARLERLELELPLSRNPATINPPSFPALCHLALDVYDEQIHSIVTSFLQGQCMGSSLSTFTLRTAYPIPEIILPQLLDTHGTTLKTLTLRNDLHPQRYPKPVIPFSPIQQESVCLIRNACHELKQLSVCVSRKGEAAVFDLLATFSSSLRHLTLDFGSGCNFIHVPAATTNNLFWQEDADTDGNRMLSSDDIEEWEHMLWLHMPLACSDVEEMFRAIYKRGNGASSLETLVVRIRHPWASNTQQEFLVQRQLGGKGLKISIVGYKIPEGEERVLEFNEEVSREDRLKMMQAKLCPVDESLYE